MAIETQHMNFFSPQLLSNRDCVKFQRNMNHGDLNLAAGEVPFIAGESLAVESGVSYNFNSSVLPQSRKRPRKSQFRDSDAQFCDSDAQFRDSDAQFTSAVKRRSTPSFIDSETLTQIQNHQQAEIEQFISQQTEKLRIEIETHHRMLTSAFQNAITKKLKEKDDEIVRLKNLNWVLQERLKSLYDENQIWREIAQTNEANANNLRTNLVNVLAQIETFPNAADDVESSCGSCGGGDEDNTAVSGGCKWCGEREASVLVLPCRHLCLCNVCGSALLQNCPVCDSVMNASVHVNMSS